MIAVMDVYITRVSRFGLLVMDRTEGYAWLRARGLPAFFCRKRKGFLTRPEDVIDITTMARYEGIRVTEHRASSPRQARIRRDHATRSTRARRTA